MDGFVPDCQVDGTVREASSSFVGLFQLCGASPVDLLGGRMEREREMKT